jgi:hypothetical protein
MVSFFQFRGKGKKTWLDGLEIEPWVGVSWIISMSGTAFDFAEVLMVLLGVRGWLAESETVSNTEIHCVNGLALPWEQGFGTFEIAYMLWFVSPVQHTRPDVSGSASFEAVLMV